MFWTTIVAVLIATGKMPFFSLSGRALFRKCVRETCCLTNVIDYFQILFFVNTILVTLLKLQGLSL